jgi:ABC-type multidrug transport system permease subunit
MMQRFLAVFRARNREFLRDHASLSWNLLFPVLIVMGFAFAFSGETPALFKVGVYNNQAHQDLEFFATAHVQFIPVDELTGAITKVERHQLDMAIDADSQRYWINTNSPRGYLLERVLLGTDARNFQKSTVTGEEVRYVDWLVPGLLAMNMMFSALYGVGYVIVRYRKNGVLKRLKATPLTAFEFLAAQVTSRLWLTLMATLLVFIGTDFFIDFRMFGSYLDLFIVFFLGAISLISLGMIVAARTASEELAEGLVNLISWPMVFLSGVWFSLEGIHPSLQKLAFLFPLTHLIESARAIMIDGVGLNGILGHLVILLIMSGIFLTIGAYTFRWE